MKEKLSFQTKVGLVQAGIIILIGLTSGWLLFKDNDAEPLKEALEDGGEFFEWLIEMVG